MLICSKCQTPHADISNFCASCGSVIAGVMKTRGRSEVCGECGYALRAGASFCTHCGKMVRKEEETTRYKVVVSADEGKDEETEP